MALRIGWLVMVVLLGSYGMGMAQVTRIQITRVDSFAVGKTFGDVGAYERVIGTVYGELDPAEPRNAGIVGLVQAPRNARGLVAYEADLFLLRPVDASKGNGKLLFEVLNRGRKLMLQMLLQVPSAPASNPNDPKLAYDAGDGLLMRMGYTMAWAGWDPGAPRNNEGMVARLPVLKGVTRVIREEFVPGTRHPAQEKLRLSFAAAGTAQPDATLSIRVGEADLARMIPRQGFRFADDHTVELLLTDPKPQPGLIYDLTYTAIDPPVSGMGFAIQRDVVAFLRANRVDAAGTANPAGGRITHAIGFGISQSGRFLRDFIQGGFNQSLAGQKVFDGVLSHVAGIGGMFLNELFAQPDRTRTLHQDRTMPENRFPFSAAVTKDPVSGKQAARLRNDGFDPLWIESNTSTEYWQKGASLLHTDPEGKQDLELPANTRVFLIAGTQHGGRAGSPDAPGACANPRNPHSAAPALRALLVALDKWITAGTPPPQNRVPRIADATLVAAAQLNFPPIPGLVIARAANPVDVEGDWVKPERRETPYRALVPAVYRDGNESTGIRLPDIAQPAATYTGWNLYAPPYPNTALCDRDGSYAAFAPTDAARVPGDPRPSLRTRYGDKANFVSRLSAAARELVAEGLLLEEDAGAYIAAARRVPEF